MMRMLVSVAMSLVFAIGVAHAAGDPAAGKAKGRRLRRMPWGERSRRSAKSCIGRQKRR